MKKTKIEIFENGLFINGFEIPNCTAKIKSSFGVCGPQEVVIHCYPDELILDRDKKPDKDIETTIDEIKKESIEEQSDAYVKAMARMYHLEIMRREQEIIKIDSDKITGELKQLLDETVENIKNIKK